MFWCKRCSYLIYVERNFVVKKLNVQSSHPSIFTLKICFSKFIYQITKKISQFISKNLLFVNKFNSQQVERKDFLKSDKITSETSVSRWKKI